MRTELSRCEKELPARLARRLSLPTSSLAPIKRLDNVGGSFAIEEEGRSHISFHIMCGENQVKEESFLRY